VLFSLKTTASLYFTAFASSAAAAAAAAAALRL
jgi:hypothetical protein